MPVRLTAEVQQHIGQNQVRAVAMSTTDGVTRGMQALDTGAADHRAGGRRARWAASSTCWASRWTAAPPIPDDAERWPIHRETPKFTDLEPKTEIFETGIKVIDLIAPFVKGGKIGLFGGAGVGKTVVIQELINNVRRATAASRSSAAWASGPARATTSTSRSRKRASSSSCALIYGQMNEPPGARLRVGLTGLTVAEYFRDVEGQDVLLFIDNIFRFTQAGSEVSALLGRMPSAVGLPADAGDRDGRPAGADHLDQQGLDHLGAGDLRARRRPDRPGAGHRVRAPRRHGRALARRSRSWASTPRWIRSTARAGFSIRSSSASGTTTSRSACSGPCSATRRSRTSSRSSAWTSSREEDKLIVARARRLQRFLSQPFFVAEQFTGFPGKYVKLEDTIASFERVLSGEFDHLPEQAFYMVGGIDDVVEQAQEAGGGVMRVTVISPEASMFDGEADAVVVPAFDGQVGILPNHAPFMTPLGKGLLTVKHHGKAEQFRIAGGFLQVVSDTVRVVAEAVQKTD